mmetsp:Transcript_28049/g.32140  ORF Transcript_28049/g.32140 Transcript_28049/m.32140 type:complete len:80 (+) Transcript_28049:570-809(+)
MSASYITNLVKVDLSEIIPESFTLTDGWKTREQELKAYSQVNLDYYCVNESLLKSILRVCILSKDYLSDDVTKLVTEIK